METKKQAIRRLKKQGEKELYVVTDYIEADGQCTDVSLYDRKLTKGGS